MGEVFGQSSGEPGEVVWRDFGAMDYSIPGNVALVACAFGMITYDVRSPASVPALLFAYVLSMVCFMILGCLLGTLIPKTRAAQGVGLMLFFVMVFVSGTSPP